MGVEFAIAASAEEAREVVRACDRVFGEEQAAANLERFLRILPRDRILAGRDRGAVVATAGAFSFDVTVPGGHVPAAGVTLVTVAPTHRRRGLLREMMRRQLDDVHARGEPLATLFATEGGIYGRFGYGLAFLLGSMEAERHRTAFRVPPVPAEARLLDEAEALERLPPLYDRAALDVPGMTRRPRSWWEASTLADTESDRRGAGPLMRALLELGDGEAGYALYRLQDEWVHGTPAGTVHVAEALGTSAAAEREVWRFLFSVDLADTVKGRMLPQDSALPLFVVDPARLRLRQRDGLWCRVVDVEAAFAARGYAAGTEVAVELTDPFCPWNEGRWLLSPAGAQRTDRPADLALAADALGSLYLGGFPATRLARAGLVCELVPGALARADALLGWHRAPWCPEIF